MEIFLSSVFCTQTANCVFHHTLGQLPSHDTGHCVNTVALGWVGAPNERTPFRVRSRWFRRSMSVEDSESRRFELNIRLSISEADMGPTSAPELFFSGFSKSLELSV